MCRRILRASPWKVRFLISLFIAYVPSNFLRITLHRLLNGYRIDYSARIGFGTMLVVDDARIGKAVIRWFNRFEGPFSLVMQNGATIGPSNYFTCLFDAPRNEDGTPRSYCNIGTNVRIGEKHLIDSTKGFQIGHHSWIAGCESQFWTHGPKNGPVVIGDDCFIGSAVCFAPGSSIGNHALVAMGSVVTKSFGDNVMIGGVPARVISKEQFSTYPQAP